MFFHVSIQHLPGRQTHLWASFRNRVSSSTRPLQHLFVCAIYTLSFGACSPSFAVYIDWSTHVGKPRSLCRLPRSFSWVCVICMSFHGADLHSVNYLFQGKCFALEIINGVVMLSCACPGFQAHLHSDYSYLCDLCMFLRDVL